MPTTRTVAELETAILSGERVSREQHAEAAALEASAVRITELEEAKRREDEKQARQSAYAEKQEALGKKFDKAFAGLRLERLAAEIRDKVLEYYQACKVQNHAVNALYREADILITECPAVIAKVDPQNDGQGQIVKHEDGRSIPFVVDWETHVRRACDQAVQEAVTVFQNDRLSTNLIDKTHV